MPARAILVMLLMTASVKAAAPPYIPLQGILTDAQGVPIDGSVEMTFGLYDTEVAGPPLWSETQQVSVDNGLFAVYLGGESSLNLSLFHTTAEYWLGVQVGGDPEMDRIYIGSTPYSAYAELSVLGASIESNEITDGTIQLGDLSDGGCSTDQVIRYDGSRWICSSGGGQEGVPAGAVMAFDLTECPQGWTELAEARGRTIMGLPAGGTLRAMVGAELGDQAERNITQVPAHTHTISGSGATTTTDGAHAHALTDPGHTHNYPEWTGGSGGPKGAWMPDGNLATHSVTSSTTGITIASDGAHSHTLDLGSLTADSTGAAEVPVTMPYIQLLLCRKN